MSSGLIIWWSSDPSMPDPASFGYRRRAYVDGAQPEGLKVNCLKQLTHGEVKCPDCRRCWDDSRADVIFKVHR